MARSLHEPAERYSAGATGHVRREDLIRPDARRREFSERHAQRRLSQKERRWAPIAYAVFALAIVVIFCVAYVTYAFSEYRGVILPGVQVDNISLAGLSEGGANSLVWQKLRAIGQSPVILTYGPDAWKPSKDELGVTYDPLATAREAMQVGRQGSFFEQLIDRLPLHLSHSVPLVYYLREPVLRSYIRANIAGAPPHGIYLRPYDAQIASAGDRFVLRPSHVGLRLDVGYAIQTVHDILGSLHKQARELRAIHLDPQITDADAEKIIGRVNGFLAHPPVIAAGRRVFVMTSADLVSMVKFSNTHLKHRATIVMNVIQPQITAYVSNLASQVDRPAANPVMQFTAGHVIVLRPRRLGRTLDQTAAYQSLLAAVSGLRQNARLHFKVAVTQPPVDVTNAGSLGINSLLGEGTSTFAGSGDTRLADVISIAKSFDQTEINPGQDISFNYLVGQNWPSRVYDDRETLSQGQLVPGRHGAMQQVATTFLRALYGSGLKLLERHAHPYRLSWYEPPVGLDAVVDPGRNWDLRFRNTTGSYLLIQTRVEPLRHQIYIYVYGKNQGWKVSVDPIGKVLKVYPHPRTVVRQDPSLAPGQIKQVAWPHDGADTVVQRTITYPNGKVAVEEVDTHYSAWQGISLVGSNPGHQPGATPTPTPSSGKSATPSPTPTFSH
ncbi:MAG TPA: VanW family protein [Chloroflexota bacterium]|nr:VanW family protein [Chloroflexota bacterium]